jgi:methionyl-tRNA formyltransferase
MRLRVVFFGSPEFAVPCLEAVAAEHDVLLVLSQPDRPAGRGKALTPPAVKVTAQRLGLPVEQPTALKDPALAARLAGLDPDVFVVVAYGRILPPALLAIPRHGPWNVHASLLPALRGAAPIQWAVIRGDRRTGVCIMRMEAGLDTGPVAARLEEPIGDEDTAGTLAERLSRRGAQLLVETLPRIAAGAVTIEPQDHSQATLAPLLKKEDGVLDFRQPAPAVSAHARGVDPWPGAMTVLAGEVLKLFRPRVVAGAPDAAPGQVLGVQEAGLVVACGQGAVAFGELQLPGRKRLPAPAVLAGHPIPAGTILGGTL